MRLESILYNTLNPLMRAFLRSPMHGMASGSICILHYRGRKSGKAYMTPLSFTREGSVVLLLSSHNTRWWNNFLAESADVEVEIARETFRGKARTTIEDGDRFRDGVRTFLTAVPRDARIYGIKLDGNRKPREADIATAAGHVVLVEVELER